MAQGSSAVNAAIAATRFGLGARPGEIEAASADPRAWLASQISPEGADQPAGAFPSSADQIRTLRDYQQDVRAMRRGRPAAGAAMSEPAASGSMPRQPAAGAEPAEDPLVAAARRRIRESAGTEFLARIRLACATPASFRERWALFWFNHFTVSACSCRPRW
jgi:uncharacterized protein (DUF1800 family)